MQQLCDVGETGMRGGEGRAEYVYCSDLGLAATHYMDDNTSQS